jgi:hypothetical protein
MAIDLTAPSRNTALLLRQWLAVYHGQAAPSCTVFSNGMEEAESQIVQLTAQIVAEGAAYWPAGSVTPSLLRLARKLNEGNRFALLDPYLAALTTGEPKWAEMHGVSAVSDVAVTGPKSA